MDSTNHSSKTLKWYELKKWDKARHGDEIHTFIRPDGCFAKWETHQWEMVTGQYDEYKMWDDWIYQWYICPKSTQ